MYKRLFICLSFSLSIVTACNAEPQVFIGEQNEVQAGTEEVKVTPSKEGNDEIINLLNEIKKELIVSIAKQPGIEKESIEIIVGTSSVEGNIDVDVSVSLPKDAKIDDATIQQIVEDIIKIVSKKENVTISEENVEIKIK
ncbi:hypothetical protein ACTWP4_17525 [Gracilibacillus sp. D59]|uniref:hypothetical protein n=1 Tax=Gracilibacillus sp. D59 TaxID=3457434 RepID=UPI003FCDE10F